MLLRAYIHGETRAHALEQCSREQRVARSTALPTAPAELPASARLPLSRLPPVPCGLSSWRYLRGERGLEKDDPRRHGVTVAAAARRRADAT